MPSLTRVTTESFNLTSYEPRPFRAFVVMASQDSSSRRYDLCYGGSEIARIETRSRFNGALMKAAMGKITRKHFFVIFLGLLSAFSFGISASARAAELAPADRISAAQAADLGIGVDAQAAAQGGMPSNTSQVPTSAAQALKNPGTEGGSTPGPGFFLLIGLALIGVRLIISYRSRKVKNLATETH
jgi:hypothetical protein